MSKGSHLKYNLWWFQSIITYFDYIFYLIKSTKIFPVLFFSRIDLTSLKSYPKMMSQGCFQITLEFQFKYSMEKVLMVCFPSPSQRVLKNCDKLLLNILWTSKKNFLKWRLLYDIFQAKVIWEDEFSWYFQI